ncbi:MAG: hypothetical protein MK185_10300 [Saccharospirillaceae bacterium]|nr:hypothetical protein [Saccharospirillaceae bacterium]
MKQLSLLLLMVISSQLALASVSLREDSFELYAKYSSESGFQYYFAPKEHLLLITADVSIPVPYEDHSNTITPSSVNYFQDYLSLTDLSGGDIPSNAVNIDDSYEKYPGDFNGDGYGDILYLYKNNGLGISPSIIAFGHSESSRNIKRVDFYQKLGGAKADSASIDIVVSDVNQDGADDITVSRSGYSDQVLYSGARGLLNVNGSGVLDYSHLPKAKKPNGGTIIAGSDGGSFRVSESGTATYAIPIDVPVGPGGVRPDVSVSYNSNSGNGLMGMGWSLNAVSTISHCSIGFEISGSDTERNKPALCLDGAPLKSFKFDSFNSIEYRTEIDSISKITRELSGGYGRVADIFKVQKKDGTLWRYSWKGIRYRGLMFGSDGETSGAWYLDSITDNKGNEINYTYDFATINESPDDESLSDKYVIYGGISPRLDSISYIGAVISFDYESREDKSDHYVSGIATELNSRLKSISVTSDDLEVASYSFDYGYDEASGQSLLRFYQQCHGSLCYEPVEFEWEAAEHSGAYERLTLFNNEWGGMGLPLKPESVSFADFTGDGMLDFLSYSPDMYSGNKGYIDVNYPIRKLADQLNISTSVRSRGMLTPKKECHQAAYVDDLEDGDTDILCRNGNKLYLFSNTGVKLKNIYLGTLPSGFSGGMKITDFNADGIQDLVYKKYDENAADPVKYKHYYIKGTGSIASSLSSALSGNGAQHELIYSSSQPDDIVLNVDDPNLPQGFFFQQTATRMGYRQHHSHRATYYVDEKMSETLLLDINGDGYSDVVKPGKIYINTGRKFNPPITIASEWSLETAKIVDYNLDGYPDILYPDAAGKWKLLISNGHTLVRAEAPDFLPDYVQGDIWRVIDLHSDGISDFVRIHKDGKKIEAYVHRVSDLNQVLAGTITPSSRIKKVIDSSGNTTVSYKSINAIVDTVYRPDTGSRYLSGWGYGSTIIDINTSMKVVSHVSSKARIYAKADGQGGSLADKHINVSYRYQGLKAQLGGRGSLGFRILSTLDMNSGVRTTTEYAQKFPYIGMPIATAQIKLANIAADDAGFAEIINTIKDNEQPSGAMLRAFSVSAGPELLTKATDYLETQSGDWWKPAICGSYFPVSEVNGSVTSRLPNEPTEDTLLSCSVSKLNKKIIKQGIYFPYVEGSSEHFFRDDGKATYAKVVESRYQDVSSGDVPLFSGDTVSVESKTYDLSKSGLTSDVLKGKSYSSTALVPSFSTLTQNKFEQNDYEKWHLGRLTEAKVTHKRAGKKDEERLTQFTYRSSDGLLATTTSDPDKTELSVLTVYDYDSFGNKKSTEVKSAPGVDSKLAFWRKSEVEYDNNGRYPVKEYVYTANNTSSKRLVKHITSRNNLGLVVRADSYIDASNKLSIDTDYDSAGRIKNVTNYFADGSSKQVQSKNYYLCRDSSVCPIAAYNYLQTNYAAAPNTREFYDVYGQQVRTSKIDFSGEWVHTDRAFDAQGRVVAVSNPHKGNSYFSNGVIATKTQYDWFGRPYKITHHDGSRSEFNYREDDVFSVTVNNFGKNSKGLEEQQSVTTTKNAVGETLRVVRNGNDKHVSTFEYDVQGNMTNLITGTDSNTHQIENKFNKIGQKVQTIDSDKGTWTYAYNANGQLLRQANALGNLSVYSYDNLGRKTNEVVYKSYTVSGSDLMSATPDASKIESNVTTVYDTQPYGWNKPTSVTDSISGYSKTYTYEPKFGKTDLITTTFKNDSGFAGQNTYYSRSTYDNYGRVQEQFDASGLSASNHHNVSHLLTNAAGIKNIYDEQTGYLKQVVDATNVQYKYYEVKQTDVFGNIVRYTYGNGITTTRKFSDLSGRLESVQAGKSSANEITNLGYKFDDFGNLASRDDLIGGFKETFEYTALNQLAKAKTDGASVNFNCTNCEEFKRSYNFTQTYDVNKPWQIATSTRATEGRNDVGTYKHLAGKNQLERITYVSGSDYIRYVYDSQGNRTHQWRKSGSAAEQLIRQVSFSSFDKPLSITKGEYRTDFVYGPSQKRVVREDFKNGVLTKTTRYVGAVEHIKAGSELYFRRNIAGVAVKVTSGSKAGLTYLHKDHAGSITAVTDQSGVLKDRFSYDAYGKRRQVITNGIVGNLTLHDFLNKTSASTNRGYTGHEMLDEVGLIHMNGRVYDPLAGVFLSADPFVQAPGEILNINRYSYVKNNPLSYTDPSGFFYKKIRRAAKKAWKKTWKVAKKAGKLSLKVGGALVAGKAGWKAGERLGNWADENQKMLLTVAVTIAMPGGCVYMAMLSGAVTGYIQTGTLKGAVIGAAFAAASAGIGRYVPTTAGKALAHGVSSGLRSRVSGGKFSDGFKSALISKAFSPVTNGMWDNTAAYDGHRIITSAIVGGTVSKLNGGKFENGAVSSAMIQAFNTNPEMARERARSAINLFKEGAIHDDWIKSRPELDSEYEFEVFAHGDENNVFDDRLGLKTPMTAQELANMIRNDSGYSEGMPVRLCSCNTGANSNGFAQDLANELQVDVTAPNRYWHPGIFGGLDNQVRGRFGFPKGEWVKFNPNMSPN